jgi:hypothetical protein
MTGSSLRVLEMPPLIGSLEERNAGAAKTGSGGMTLGGSGNGMLLVAVTAGFGGLLAAWGLRAGALMLGTGGQNILLFLQLGACWREGGNGQHSVKEFSEGRAGVKTCGCAASSHSILGSPRLAVARAWTPASPNRDQGRGGKSCRDRHPMQAPRRLARPGLLQWQHPQQAHP